MLTETALRQSEGRLRQFVADASHELRTPVAAVSAYAELFERGAESRPQDLARVMHGIRNETARMGHLVEDLLLLARLDESRPLERSPVDLVEIARQAVEAAGAVGPEWRLGVEASEPVIVAGDASRLRQVVDNLLANVRAHTPPGTTATVAVSRPATRPSSRSATTAPESAPTTRPASSSGSIAPMLSPIPGERRRRPGAVHRERHRGGPRRDGRRRSRRRPRTRRRLHHPNAAAGGDPGRAPV